MTNISVLENKKSAVKKYLKILERYQKYSREEIEHDIDIRGMVERYVYLAAQATIDLAEAEVARRKFRKPTSMTDAFHILSEEGIIEGKLVPIMVDMVGFRNVLAHGYEKVDYDIVYDVLHNGYKDILELIDNIKI